MSWQVKNAVNQGWLSGSMPMQLSLRLLSIVWLFVLTSCTSLPPLENRAVSYALNPEQAATTRFAQMLAPLQQAHPDKSGIYPLADALDAFAARMLLAQHAERTLDIQYYIWHKDMTGTLLFEALHEAADRGVRVRLLLDDNNTSGLDETLSVLDSHPNIQVRLFNPFMRRSYRAVEYLTDFNKANRRMHNKSFTVDNQLTIIGGRNVGDEYFGAGDGVLFADLDILAAGPVVQDVSHDFDRYWQSESAYPVGLILPEVSPARLQELEDQAEEVERNPAAAKFVQSLHQLPILNQLTEQTLALEWAKVTLVSDDPRKGLGDVADDDLLFGKLIHLVGSPEKSLNLVSPYFVPTKVGAKAFANLSQAGVEIQILTNSLHATDVYVVHSGYAKWRKKLVKNGVKLYEMRQIGEKSVKPKLLNRTGDKEGLSTVFGSSGSSLHAKTFTLDDDIVFVGSFNFDPRSAKLNTELGFVIEDSQLSQKIKAAFAEEVPYNAYEVQLCNNSQLCWIEKSQTGLLIHHTEPESTLLKRAGVQFLSWLPIDWLL